MAGRSGGGAGPPCLSEPNPNERDPKAMKPTLSDGLPARLRRLAALLGYALLFIVIAILIKRAR